MHNQRDIFITNFYFYSFYSHSSVTLPTLLFGLNIIPILTAINRRGCEKYSDLLRDQYLRIWDMKFDKMQGLCCILWFSSYSLPSTLSPKDGVKHRSILHMYNG